MRVEWRRANVSDESSFELVKDLNETRVVRPLVKAEAFKKQHLKMTFRVRRQSIMVWGGLGGVLSHRWFGSTFRHETASTRRVLPASVQIDEVLWPHLGVDVATSCGRDPLFVENNGPFTLHVRQTNCELNCRFLGSSIRLVHPISARLRTCGR